MNYITIDIETTGLDIIRDSPIQIAWEVRNEDYKLLEANSILVKANKKLDIRIVAITRITDELLRTQGIPPSAAGNIYHSLLRKYFPAVLIGYNILNFDFPMIQNWLTRVIPGRFKHPPIMGVQDVMFTCCDYFKTKKWPKLVAAGQRLKIDFNAENLHDARADVNLTWKIFEKLSPKEEK